MKNLFNKLFLFALVGSFVFLYSCGEDEPEPTTDAPSIDFSVTGGTLNATMDTVFVDFGGTIDWTFNITAPGGFNTFRLSGAVTGEFTRTDLGLEAGATSATVSATTGPWDQVGNFTVTATAVDDVDTGQTSSADVVVSVSGVPARAYSAVLLFAPLAEDPDTGGDQRTSETWFSTNLGEAISSAEIVASTASSADVDFGYYYTSAAYLSSPASYNANVYDLSENGQNWGTLNGTMFKETTLTSTDFTETTLWSQLDDAYAAGTNEAGSLIVEADKVYAFSTDADKGAKKGLILVKAIVDGDNDGSFFGAADYVEMDILVQEDAN